MTAQEWDRFLADLRSLDLEHAFTVIEGRAWPNTRWSG
jgi:hypothetical protein